MVTTDNKEIVIDALVKELFKSWHQIDFSGLSLKDRSTITERLGDLHWERYQQDDRKEMLDKSLEYYLLSGVEEKAIRAAKQVVEGSTYFQARIKAVQFLQSKGESDYLREKIALRLPQFLTEP